jgi:hypothetical protein
MAEHLFVIVHFDSPKQEIIRIGPIWVITEPVRYNRRKKKAYIVEKVNDASLKNLERRFRIKNS